MEESCIAHRLLAGADVWNEIAKSGELKQETKDGVHRLWAGMRIRCDPAIPGGEVHFIHRGKVVGRIIRLAEVTR